MPVRRRWLRPIVTVGIVIACAVALLFPLLAFLDGYRRISAAVAQEATDHAGVVSKLAAEDPRYWIYKTDRLIVAIGPTPAESARHTILDERGETVVELGPGAPSPTVTGRADIVENGVKVGEMLLTASLRPVLARTAWALLVGLLAGGAVTLAIWMLPKRALEQTFERLAEANRSLELRTAELGAAMRELESFSYSVSHDLRAPVRAVDGFAGILLEDHGDALPAEARRLLERIAAAGKSMSAMIDGLLELSRLARSELVRRPVDLSALAREVWAEVAAAEPGRRVEFLAEDGCAAEGDAVLLRNALQNLLGNAFKYTRRTEAARVAFGRFAQDGERGFVVRDNGAGFDPRYAAKLFEPFGRLHGADEFEGTGVGLATVRRIVERHGGRVWAESVPGAGATFHFTLGPA